MEEERKDLENLENEENTSKEEQPGKVSVGAVTLGLALVGGLVYGISKGVKWVKKRKADKLALEEDLQRDVEDSDLEEPIDAAIEDEL